MGFRTGSPEHTSAPPGLHPGWRGTGPELEVPVNTSMTRPVGMTDAEREEMRRKLAETNRRSSEGSGRNG